jgi:hypothetical protein
MRTNEFKCYMDHAHMWFEFSLIEWPQKIVIEKTLVLDMNAQALWSSSMNLLVSFDIKNIGADLWKILQCACFLFCE